MRFTRLWRRHWLDLVALTVAIGTLLFPGIVCAEPTPDQLTASQAYMQAAKAVIPALDQFRVSVRATLNGQLIGNGVIGWSSGMRVSGSFISPFLGPWVTEFALRPSGMVFIRRQGEDRFIGDLALHADLLAMIPRVVNRSLTDAVLAALGAGAEFGEDATISSRPAQMLITHADDQAYAKATEIIVSRLLADQGASHFVNWLGKQIGKSPNSTTTWLKALPKLVSYSLKTERLFDTPLYLDKADGIATSIDTSAWPEGWQNLAWGDVIPTVWELQIEDVESDQAGHINSLTYRFKLPDLDEYPTNGAPVQVSDAELFITLGRNGNIYLPKVLEARFYPIPANDDPADEVLAQPEFYSFRLNFTWDLKKGADSKLVDNVVFTKVEDAWLQAVAAYNAKDYAKAKAPLESVIELSPAFTAAYWRLAEVYDHTKQYAAEAQTIERLIKLLPDNVQALNNLAWVYVEYELDVKKGLELAIKAYDMSKGADRLYSADTLGWAYYRNGMYAEAVESLQEAVELAEEFQDDDGIVYYHLAAALYARKKYPEALVNAKKAIVKSPELVEAAQLIEQVRTAMQEVQ